MNELLSSLCEEERNMDSSFKISTSTRPSRRLVFDRRYGLVFDDWIDPSEEALAGGRGMFCIVPLANNLFKTASNLANATACSAIKVVENPYLLSPPMLQATVNSHLQKFISAIPKPPLDFLVKRHDSQ